MADAPWRCSQCGTVNEPNANACRSCGRWPSLFDLERSAADTEPADIEEEFEAVRPREAPAPVEAEPAPIEAAPPVETGHDYSGVPDKPAEWPGPENPMDRPLPGWAGRLSTWIVPILVVLYIVISALVNR